MNVPARFRNTIAQSDPQKYVDNMEITLNQSGDYATRAPTSLDGETLRYAGTLSDT